DQSLGALVDIDAIRIAAEVRASPVVDRRNASESAARRWNPVDLVARPYMQLGARSARSLHDHDPGSIGRPDRRVEECRIPREPGFLVVTGHWVHERLLVATREVARAQPRLRVVARSIHEPLPVG